MAILKNFRPLCANLGGMAEREYFFVSLMHATRSICYTMTFLFCQFPQAVVLIGGEEHLRCSLFIWLRYNRTHNLTSVGSRAILNLNAQWCLFSVFLVI